MNALLDADKAPIVIAVLAGVAIKSGLVMGLATLAVLCMERRAAAARHLVWFLSIASLLFLPALSCLLPGWEILPRWYAPPPSARVEPAPSLPRTQMPSSPAPTFQPTFAAPLAAESSVAPSPEQSKSQPTVSAKRFSIQQSISRTSWFRELTIWQWTLATWLAGTCLAIGPILLGRFAIWRLGRKARREAEPSWLDLLRTLITGLNIQRRVSLLKSDQRRMPMTWGCVRPKVLLPEESQAWPVEQRRVVMLHELAHVRRWDYLTHLITQLVCALYWFNPLVWFAALQMATERERACDDIVLSHGAKPTDYAGQLLEIAARLPVGGLAGLSTIPMARPSKLEGRLRAILDNTRNRAGVTRLAVVVMVAALLCVVGPIAVMKAAPGATGNSPTETALLGPDDGSLPSHTETLREAFAGNVTLVVAAQALNDPASELGFSGVVSAKQDFRLTEALYGELPAETRTNISYSYLSPGMWQTPADRAVRKGEKVIWIVRPSAGFVHWVKAIADTPAGRAEVKERLAWVSATNRPNPNAARLEESVIRAHLPQAEVIVAGKVVSNPFWPTERQAGIQTIGCDFIVDHFFKGSLRPGDTVKVELNRVLEPFEGMDINRGDQFVLFLKKDPAHDSWVAEDPGFDVQPLSRPGLTNSLERLLATGGNAGAGNSTTTATDLEDTPISERKVTLSVEQVPLRDVLKEICHQARTELELDDGGLKQAGVSLDTPITLKCRDESLMYAVGRIIWLLQRQGIYEVAQDTRSGKLNFGSIRGLVARLEQAQPNWLKGYGSVVAVDDQTNVVSVIVGAKADDAFFARLKTLPKLRELDIQATKTVTPAGLAHLAELPALEKINLYHVNEGGDGLGDAALQAISQSKTLRDLGVSQSKVTDEGLRSLADMTQLTAISLTGNAITDAGVKHLAGLTNLQQLDLSRSGGITDEGMKSLSRMFQLRSLSIGSLAGITDAGLKHLSGSTNLQSLACAGTAVTTRDLPFPHLQSLEFSDSQVTDATLDNIAQYHDLRRLSLQYTSVTDAGLARIAGLNELRQLSLSSRYVTDAGIAHLQTLPKLEHVELRADGASDKSLASLAQIKSLTRLDLYGSGESGVSPGRVFTMDGLLQLRALPSLRTLWINNLVLPEGFLGLRELKQLSSITLFFCNVSDAEEELLKAAMPDTAVSAVSGGGKWVSPKTPVTLPEVSVRITGRAVDDQSGQPIQNCTLELGAENPDKPGEIMWGEALQGARMEVAGNDPQDRSRFWGESFRPGKVRARLLASGYQPSLLTPLPVVAPLQMTNLVVRMKRGGDFHGTVLDYQGNPAPGIRVYLADKSSFYLRDGVDNSSSKASYGVTDANGRFTLPGGNGTAQRLVAASADGRLFQIATQAQLNQDVRITLPQPATLILRFDIPNDSTVAQCFLNLDSQKSDPAIWKDTSFGLSPVVTNRSELVLTNLSPGYYTFARRKMLHVGSGRRFQFLDNVDLLLKAGETQRVDIVRPVGQTVRGQVTGIEEAKAIGAYLYACVGEITNSPISSWNPGPLIDLGTCGKDGVFQMSRFPPGDYSIVAMAYKEPNVYSHSGDGDFIGVGKVTVTANTPLEPVKIELRPRE